METGASFEESERKTEKATGELKERAYGVTRVSLADRSTACCRRPRSATKKGGRGRVGEAGEGVKTIEQG